MVISIQRIENLLIAAAILFAVFYLDLSWWVLLATFLLFDLSMIGYAINPRVGAICYNLVHNYTGPALLAITYVTLWLLQIDHKWLALVAACWGFHVGVDRALGYGLKFGSFTDTHLGKIGKKEEPAKK